MAKRQAVSVVRDFATIALSILVAILLVRTHALADILTATKQIEVIGSFVAGIFFTSVFTVAPAVVVLGELARSNSLILVAVAGGLGAVVGDLIIFRFVRDRLSGHVLELLQQHGVGKRMRALFRLNYFRWFTFLLGGLIIASPLPDELGVSLLGFTRMRLPVFIPLSFTFNAVGIFLIGSLARAL
ncbi:MAG: hypothetical protein IT406_00780 [Candidatus Yanofskybacteria bacterium]|nr:hypothetical protein [Candidatus Yanofskybacteria bacterium]